MSEPSAGRPQMHGWLTHEGGLCPSSVEYAQPALLRMYCSGQPAAAAPNHIHGCDMYGSVRCGKFETFSTRLLFSRRHVGML